MAAVCPFGSPRCFSVVNASGATFGLALQLAVAQGLVNRHFGASVFIVGSPQFPGMKGIEWFPGSGCANCHGIRERWLTTYTKIGVGRQAVPLASNELLNALRRHSLVKGGAMYSEEELHSLGPVMTACGTHDLLPVVSTASLPGLEIKFDGRRRWSNALDATWFVARELLPHTNRSTLALQAPTELPFLADAVVTWKLAMIWMDDMCHDPHQNAALRYILEGSRHFSAARQVEYLGWFNHTRLANTELVGQCTSEKRLITIASDFAENLSFLARLPASPSAPSEPWKQPPDAVTVSGYTRDRTYIAIIVSDGDNLAQDLWNLRPRLERRLELRSRVPISWTVSNRWRDFGRPVLQWFYSAAGSSKGFDSFLMGPSGYGYLFPGAIEANAIRIDFARRTTEAAHALGMEAYVHWDVDRRIDPDTTQRTTAAVSKYNNSAIRGVFMLGSDPIKDTVGDVVVINHPALPWGWDNATAAAHALNSLERGTVSYVYMNMKADPQAADTLSANLAPHVTLLGYRELIRVAQMKAGLPHK